MKMSAADIRSVGDAMGPGGIAAAQHLFPWLTDDDEGLLAGSNTTCVELGRGPLKKTVLTFASRALSMTDEAGVVAWGGTKVYDMPEGNILILGATLNATLVKSGAGINADWDGDVGVGTVIANNNAALASTEQNIIPTTATPQAVAGATTAKGINAAAIAPLDGTATPVDIYLNLLIDDADQDITGGGASSLLISGTLTLTWINLGDK